MKFEMSIEDNFSSYIDPNTGFAVFIDTFDNNEFDVRVGTTEESVAIGTIVASSDDELNQKLEEMVVKYKEGL